MINKMTEVVSSVDEQVEVAESGSSYEERAAARGWRPKEEWDGEPDAWRDARTFVERGDLMEVISKQSKKIKKMQFVLDDVSVMMEKNKAAALEEAKKQLKAAKVEALSSMDYDKVVEIDEKIQEVASAAKASSNKKEADNGDEFKEYFQNNWINNNRWYEESFKMKVVADQIGAAFLSKNPDSTPEEVFSEVDKRIRREFPENFGSKQQKEDTSGSSRAPQAVAGQGQGRTTSTSRKTLTAEQKKVGQRYVELGVFKTLDEYAKNIPE